MATYAPLDIPEDGKLAHNIAHFARALRKAGLPCFLLGAVVRYDIVEVIGYLKTHRHLASRTTVMNSNGKEETR